MTYAQTVPTIANVGDMIDRNFLHGDAIHGGGTIILEDNEDRDLGGSAASPIVTPQQDPQQDPRDFIDVADTGHVILTRGDVILTTHDLVLAQAGHMQTNEYTKFNLAYWVDTYTRPITHGFFAVKPHESGYQWEFRDNLNPVTITSDVAVAMRARDVFENPPAVNMDALNLDAVTVLEAPPNVTDDSVVVFHFSIDDDAQDDVISPPNVDWI